MFNIGGRGPRSVNDVLRSVSEAIGTWIDPIRLPKRSGDIRHTHADISRAREALGWSPQARWQESVPSTVRWFVG